MHRWDHEYEKRCTLVREIFFCSNKMHLYLYKFFTEIMGGEQQNMVDSTRTKTLDGRSPDSNKIRTAKVYSLCN